MNKKEKNSKQRQKKLKTAADGGNTYIFARACRSARASLSKFPQLSSGSKSHLQFYSSVHLKRALRKIPDLQYCSDHKSCRIYQKHNPKHPLKHKQERKKSNTRRVPPSLPPPTHPRPRYCTT